MCVQLQLSQDVKTPQEDEDSEAPSSCEPRTGQSTSDSPDSSCSGSFTPRTSSPSSLSRSSPHCDPRRPRTSFRSPKSVPPGSCPSSPPRVVHPPQPVCPAEPTGSLADPLTEVRLYQICEQNQSSCIHVPHCGCFVSFQADLSKQPGAVIESLVSHSPGVFSGTFSGEYLSEGLLLHKCHRFASITSNRSKHRLLEASFSSVRDPSFLWSEPSPPSSPWHFHHPPHPERPPQSCLPPPPGGSSSPSSSSPHYLKTTSQPPHSEGQTTTTPEGRTPR